MTLLVFSGTVQLASLPLIAADAPLWVVMLTAVVVNLRFVIFSAGLHPFFRRFSIARRWLLSYFMVDMSFAMFLSRFADAPRDQRGTTEQVWFFLGMSAGSWIVWQTTSIIGIVLAAGVPAQWGLEFTAILALIAMTLPLIAGKPALIGAVTAGVIAVVAAGLPLKLGLLGRGRRGYRCRDEHRDHARAAQPETGGTSLSNVEIWLVIIGLTLVTILMRSSFLMLGDYFPLPERVQHGLRYAPVCALVALVTPGTISDAGRIRSVDHQSEARSQVWPQPSSR